MDRLTEPLTTKEHRRLVEIIGRAAPDLVSLARDAVNTRWLTDDEVESLVSALLDVFLDSRDQDDEAWREGVDADDLLGRIAKQRLSFWRA